MRISDWSSDVCSSDLELRGLVAQHEARLVARGQVEFLRDRVHHHHDDHVEQIRHGFEALEFEHYKFIVADIQRRGAVEIMAIGAARSEIAQVEGELARDGHEMVDMIERGLNQLGIRSEEHTSELQSLMRISYAVFCLKQKKKH